MPASTSPEKIALIDAAQPGVPADAYRAIEKLLAASPQKS